MLRYLFSNELNHHPKLRDSMFQDRADQFHTRLGWDVSIDDHGEERDEYDAINPLYVIWEEPDGSHGGSMRFLPTSGPNMLDDHFRNLLDGARIRNSQIWECTRFCLARNAAPQVSAALMLGGCEVGLGFDLTFSIGVFDARMVRIYRRLGWSPLVVGTQGEGREAISAGLWSFSESRAETLCDKAGIPRAQSRLWFHLSRHQARIELAHTA
ncbi:MULTISPECIES: acyl-homoserine-lactone synthase [unclassified Meridianimarinicoccus]|uniref:acyl-homoserine-lactone synthase n=1 Tax=unclassified Meridianimarinicoccus TaxID=2923344 RepID=UPI001866FB6C|nr:acyl-homoserine-lactone synthase [Fluviibacterium sp. MJW13]